MSNKQNEINCQQCRVEVVSSQSFFAETSKKMDVTLSPHKHCK